MKQLCSTLTPTKDPGNIYFLTSHTAPKSEKCPTVMCSVEALSGTFSTSILCQKRQNPNLLEYYFIILLLSFFSIDIFIAFLVDNLQHYSRQLWNVWCRKRPIQMNRSVVVPWCMCWKASPCPNFHSSNQQLIFLINRLNYSVLFHYTFSVRICSRGMILTVTLRR